MQIGKLCSEHVSCQQVFNCDDGFFVTKCSTLNINLICDHSFFWNASLSRASADLDEPYWSRNTHKESFHNNSHLVFSLYQICDWVCKNQPHQCIKVNWFLNMFCHNLLSDYTNKAKFSLQMQDLMEYHLIKIYRMQILFLGIHEYLTRWNSHWHGWFLQTWSHILNADTSCEPKWLDVSF